MQYSDEQPTLKFKPFPVSFSECLCCAAAYIATYVLAFILVGVYLAYSVLILVMRNVFVREEKTGKVPPSPAASYPAASPVAAVCFPLQRHTFLLAISMNCV